jgi:hypothetical protein
MAKKKKDWVSSILKAIGKEGDTETAIYEIADNGGYFTLGMGLTLLSFLSYYWAAVVLLISAVMFVYKWHLHNKLYPVKKRK